MNKVKTVFSIKDLENLSGVKAHTIRIWEQRYDLLKPQRTEHNFRFYNIDSLKKLLNVSYLNQHGLKISKIAEFSDTDIKRTVREIAVSGKIQSYAVNALKLAMINFDQSLFYSIYNNLAEEMTFRTIFYEVVMPIVCESGVLWQTDTITPVHEHFICTHFKQKILINIERIQSLYPRPDTVTYVLFLPDNELHDLGLLFINYELVCNGYHTVYLGESTPINDLARVNSIFDEIVFVSYFTVQPEHDKINNYIEEIDTKLLQDNDNKALLLGRQLQHYDPTRLPEKIEIYQSITDLVKDL